MRLSTTDTISENQKINISNLNPGIYLIRITSNNKSFTQKVVIQQFLMNL
ncbi:T9SS type A sorting domain-containing protein [Flavicella sediminum]